MAQDGRSTMKTILCFGDSNTYGQLPLRDYKKSRYPTSVRWTGQLAHLARQGYRIIDEGNNGRTTGLEDPVREGRSGRAYLPGCLDSHVPLDLVILMLGTNDLKKKYNPSIASITDRMRDLVRITKRITAETSTAAAQILVIAPPVIRPEFYVSDDFNYPEAVPYSVGLAQAYKNMAAQEEVHFLDAGPIVPSSDKDGAHLEPEDHTKLAKAVWERVQEILS